MSDISVAGEVRKSASAMILTVMALANVSFSIPPAVINTWKELIVRSHTWYIAFNLVLRVRVGADHRTIKSVLNASG